MASIFRIPKSPEQTPLDFYKAPRNRSFPMAASAGGKLIAPPPSFWFIRKVLQFNGFLGLGRNEGQGCRPIETSPFSCLRVKRLLEFSFDLPWQKCASDFQYLMERSINFYFLLNAKQGAE